MEESLIMGKTFDSFKREIGKNTGKAVSNFFFGDSHSTPYRRVDAERRTALAEQIAEGKRDQEERVYLNLLNSAVLENVDIVLQTKIPSDENGLNEVLSMWSAQLQTTKWRYSSKEGRIHNQFSDALYAKYSQALLMLQHIAPSSPMIEYYLKNQRSAKRKRTLSMIFSIWGLYAASAIIALITFLLYKFDVIDEDTCGWTIITLFIIVLYTFLFRINKVNTK